MNKCEYDHHGNCFAQKDTPKCYYDKDESCKRYLPDCKTETTSTKGISFKINTELNWEKICRNIIFTYGLDEEEIARSIEKNFTDYVKVTCSK